MATIVTDHAARRAQQRGIPLWALELTAIYGKAKHARGKLLQRTLRDRDITQMVETKIVVASKSDILSGLTVRAEETPAGSLVVTVFHGNK